MTFDVRFAKDPPRKKIKKQKACLPKKINQSNDNNEIEQTLFCLKWERIITLVR